MSATLSKPSSPASIDQYTPWLNAVSHEQQQQQQQLFTKSDHASRTISKVFSFLQQQVLCDVVFICHSEQMPRRLAAHRLIMATLSDYFRLMFERNAQMEIIINDIDADILEKLILYAYEGSLDMHSNNVTVILAAAHRFQIVEIVQACVRFLEKQLHTSNCLGLYKLAMEHHLPELAQIIWNYILDHFSSVMQNNREFLALSFDEMKELLASDYINVQCEEKVFEALCAWLDHDVHRQRDRLSELFGLIRLPLLKRKYLTDHVDANERFSDDRACQMLIFEAMRYHLAAEKRSTMQSIRTQPRKSTLGTLFCLGGLENAKNPLTIERYDFRTESWLIEDSMNSRRFQFGCALIDQKLYLCGGREGLKTLNSMEIYDIPSKTWTIGPPMLTNRHDLSVARIGGPFYAVGGHDGRNYLNTVERYDPETLTWTWVASMLHARCTHGVATLDQRMYAVGGRDGPMGLREVESFDPHTNRWTQCASTLKRRGSVAVAVCNDFLYAIGGYDQVRTNKNILRHEDGERYDPRCNQWTMITPFSRPKEALGIATVERRLYIVGGFDGKVLNEMECYDTETEQWERCPSLGTKREGPCIIHVPNAIHLPNNRHADTSSKAKHAPVNDRTFARLVLS